MANEILVHIKAPSRIVDDKRYLAIASGVIDFEPINLIKLTGDCKTHGPAQRRCCCIDSNCSITGNDLLTSDQTQRWQASGSDKVDVQQSSAASASINKVRNVFRIPKALLASPRSHVQRQGNNPPFKSPLHSTSTGAASGDHVSMTPTTSPKVTPAENRTTILIPNTDHQTRKRAWSDAFEFCSSTMAVANSQSTLSVDQCAGSILLQAETRTQALCTAQGEGPLSANPGAAQASGAVKGSEHNRLVSGCLRSPPKSLRLNTSFSANLADAAHEIHSPSWGATSPSCSQTVLRANVNNETASADNEISTVTVSDPTQLCTGATADSNNIRQPLTRPSPIDLTTPEATVTNVQPPDKHEAPEIEGEVSSRVKNPTTSLVTTLSSSAFMMVQALPLVISAPNPNLSQLRKPAYEYPILRATAEGLSLPKRFKPESVTRGVSKRERGYWSVPITVVGREEDRNTRQGTIGRLEDEKDPTWRPLLKHDSLTEEEFLSVWDELDRFVSSGNAGWSIKVVRRCFSIVRGIDASYDKAHLFLQIFCYGEEIPYAYAMLLVCTRMYILCKPLKWISTANEEPVVTMTGDEVRKGNLGQWGQYTDEQGRQVWDCQ